MAKYLDGAKLRTARGARSMAEVGKVLGVTRQQIHWYEKGKCLPPVDKLLMLLELYKVKFESLLSVKADLTKGEK
jgi:transcriptional regulator with XRE-family HTH domain